MKGMSVMRRPYYYYGIIPTSIIYHPYLHYPFYARELPTVNPKKFMESSQKTLPLLSDLELCINKLAQSKTLTTNIMTAAQLSKKTEVEQLIKSTGIKNIPIIDYNPDGLTLKFDQRNIPPYCCYISVQLRWR